MLWSYILLAIGMQIIIKIGFVLNRHFRDDIAPDGFTNSIVKAQAARVGKPNYAKIERLERELFPEWFKDEFNQPYWPLYGPKGKTGPRGMDAVRPKKVRDKEVVIFPDGTTLEYDEIWINV